jgi:hypothetical protein
MEFPDEFHTPPHPSLPQSSPAASRRLATTARPWAVRFDGGGLYHYAGVSAEQYQKLLNAKSIGAAMNEIKAKHKCKAVK